MLWSTIYLNIFQWFFDVININAENLDHSTRARRYHIESLLKMMKRQVSYSYVINLKVNSKWFHGALYYRTHVSLVRFPHFKTIASGPITCDEAFWILFFIAESQKQNHPWNLSCEIKVPICLLTLMRSSIRIALTHNDGQALICINFR